MSQTTVSDTGGPDRTATHGDPELARIWELGVLMALPPSDLLAKLKADAEGVRGDEQWAEGDPAASMPAIPALADLASIVSTLEQVSPPARAPDRAAWRPSPAPAEQDSTSVPDEEAMPALSTWRGPPVARSEDGWIGQNVRAAALGMLAGLAAVAAAILWLGGWLDRSHAPDAHLPSPSPVERRAEPAAQPQLESPPASPSPAAPPPSPTEAAAPTEPAADVPAAAGPSPQTLANEAAQRIAVGDVMGARELLTGIDPDPNGVLPYALAETYDPNMLAAWGVRGVTPDIPRAKELYEDALRLGNEQARQRLHALQ